MEWQSATGRKLTLQEGDITRVAADAMVNAANSALAGGGGVDGAIHRAGGPEIMRELDAIRARAGGCPTGSAVATGAGKLPAKYVFHAVGPVYRDGRHGEPELLAACYRKCLELAEEHGVETSGQHHKLPSDQHGHLRLSDRGSGGHCATRGDGTPEPAGRERAARDFRAVWAKRVRSVRRSGS